MGRRVKIRDLDIINYNLLSHFSVNAPRCAQSTFPGEVSNQTTVGEKNCVVTDCHHHPHPTPTPTAPTSRPRPATPPLWPPSLAFVSPDHYTKLAAISFANPLIQFSQRVQGKYGLRGFGFSAIPPEGAVKSCQSPDNGNIVPRSCARPGPERHREWTTSEWAPTASTQMQSQSAPCG